jgi:Putative MetA-pathway of phenol degradation
MPRFRTIAALSCCALIRLGAPAAAADGCPQPSDPIATDRPDVTNSSIVVPVGSLQSENGVNVSGRDGARIFDGSNSRLRLGVAPCLELLVDVPTFFAPAGGPARAGFSDVAPAIKWQISPLPGRFDLSAVFGAALPTGTHELAGPGVQPYLQFPWSRELGAGWGTSGMVTTFFRPSDPINKVSEQVTLVIEKKVGERASVFTEYVGDYPEHAGPSHLINSGAVYRLTPTQQVDFHVAFGLNRNAPSFITGVGYSFRLDGLFARAR